MDKTELIKAQTVIDKLFYDEKALTQWQHRLLEDVIIVAGIKINKTHKTMDFKNNSGLEFSDISSEKSREYTFPTGIVVEIQNPLKLNVSDSGGHRIFDASGKSHYIPSGWIHLEWEAKKGQPNFVK